jgi:hypothetical protein
VKTISLKKVSAVAVASLAFGTFTAIAPANAAITAFTISKNSASSGVLKVTGAVTAATSTTVTQAAISGASASSLAAIVGKGLWIAEEGYLGKVTTAAADYGSVVVDGTAVAIAAATATYNGTVATSVTQSGIVADAIIGMAVKTGAAGLLNIRGNGTNAGTSGKARFLVNGVQIGASDVASATTDNGFILPFTAPLVAGTYVGQVQITDGGTWAEAISQNFTLTVAASATLAPTASTSYMTAAGLDGAAATAGTGAAASSTTNAIPRTAVKTVGRSVAQIKVSLFKDDGAIDATANTVSCIVSGVGFCVVNAVADTYAAATARSASDTSSNEIRYVFVGTDGTAGTGTVTVSVTHASTAVETTLGTHTYSTYGDVAALAVSTTNATIGKAATTTGAASTTRVAAEATLGLLGTSTTVPAFIVKATDSSGRAANASAVPTIASSNGLAVVTGACAKDGGYTATAADVDYKSSTNGVGFYNCSFTGAANAVSGSKATLTISIVDPADATKKISTTLDVTIGGSVSTETVAFDKTAYAPGEAMVITRTAKDSAGNPVADGTASPVVSFSKAIGGTAPAAGFYKAGVSASATSSAKSGAFAPTVPGAFSVLATTGATGGATITAASSVTDANAGLLTQIDALNAKIVALNALIAKIMKKLGVK